MIHPGAETAAVSARRIEFSTSSGTTDLIDVVGPKKIILQQLHWVRDWPLPGP